MKLTFKQQLRPRPFASMLGFLDLKTGATLVVLLAVRTHSPDFSRPTNTRPQVLNKVAGIYGLIALLTVAGGNAAQLTLYIYSAFALIGLTWGIRAVNEVRYDVHPFFLSLLTFHHAGKLEANALFCSYIFLPIMCSIPSGPFISLSTGGSIPALVQHSCPCRGLVR
jgi:Inositolphosphorylceramide synthase subunit Kei1